MNEPGLAAFDRLDRVTRNTYVLGTIRPTPGGTRRIERFLVKVNRPDVTVLFRDGYHSFTSMPGFDRREYITRNRVEAASVHSQDVKDIRVKLKASLSIVNGQPTADVNATIDRSPLYFKIRSGIRYGQVDIAVIAMDQEHKVLGGAYRKQVAHLEYDEATFKLVKQSGIPYQAKMRVPSGTRYLRVVVVRLHVRPGGSAGTWVF